MKYVIQFTNWEELIIIANKMLDMRDSKDEKDHFLYNLFMHSIPKQ